MNIQQLPSYLINKLKAGEIVERPASVVKELIENSLDAGATSIVLEVKNGGTTLIKVSDNGSGINPDELDLAISHHATSKIFDENDLLNISTYGFRGEALASISEVSKFTLQTKTISNQAGFELKKIGKDVSITNCAFDKNQGTNIFIEDIFFNIPARKKFLKSDATEYRYIHDIFVNFAIVNYNIDFELIKDSKKIISLKAQQSIYNRIFDIFKKEREKNTKSIEKKDNDLQIVGLISDAGLTFGGPENIKIFVNKRIVEDKIIKKAILEGFYRQIPGNEYPLAIVFLDINPSLVDVNVHPRKTQVKFLDPNNIFNFVKHAIQNTLGENKISGATISSNYSNFQNSYKNSYFKPKIENQGLGLEVQTQFWNKINESAQNDENKDFKILGQIWDSFIIIEKQDEILLVDQHALAERTTFEKVKEEIKINGLKPEILLDPIVLNISKDLGDINTKLEKINSFGFDISEFGENKIIIYAIPSVLQKYDVQFQNLIDKLIYMQDINLEKILDELLATKACKTSIKAGQKLNFWEMENLIKQGFEHIKGMFVCQHGRPGMVQISKSDIQKMFDR